MPNNTKSELQDIRHGKQVRTSISKSPPLKNNGGPGSFHLSQLGARGTYLFAKIGNLWYNTRLSRSINRQGPVVTAGTTPSSGEMIDFKIHNFVFNGSSPRYIPFGASESEIPTMDEEQGAGIEDTLYIAPFSGQLQKLYVYAETDGGLTTFNLGVNFIDKASLETIHLPAFVVTEFEWSSDNSFSAGDILGIKMDPSAMPTALSITSIWKYNVA